MTDRTELIRVGLLVADDLEARGYRPAAVVRRLAAALATPPEPAPGRCPVCNKVIMQRPLGRLRIYCSDRCRRRHHRPVESGRNGVMGP